MNNFKIIPQYTTALSQHVTVCGYDFYTVESQKLILLPITRPCGELLKSVRVKHTLPNTKTVVDI